MRRHALRDGPDERGAQARRFTVERIDPAKGSAVGYVAKYVSKSIDGEPCVLNHRIPKYLPPLSLMLDDLGNPRPEAIAKTMGGTRSTVYRWLREDNAPRPVLLALFWLTNWGVSQINCAAVSGRPMC